MNNLDPDVAEDPANLVVYGGTGRAARSWPDYHAIVAALRRIGDEETLLVQSGRPVGVFRTHAMAPRVLLANSLLVPDWADWATFRELEAAGLTMYGQMTAGSWIYIGTQGIVQGTYETFAAVAEQRFGGSLQGRARADRGLRRHGRRAAARGGDARRRLPDRRRRLRPPAPPLRDALPRRRRARPRLGAARGRGGAGAGRGPLHRRRRRRAAGLRGRPRARRAARRRDRPDVGARPARRLRPDRHVAGATPPSCASATRRATSSARAAVDGAPLRGHGRVPGRGRDRLRLRQQPAHARRSAGGFERAFSYPGFVPAYVRPLFCRGVGPFRWVALSRQAGRHRRHRRGHARAVPRERAPAALARPGRRSASPSRACRRASAGSATATATARACASTSSSGAARCQAPIVIGRDHLDSGSVASPYRETEAMQDGSDAIADWPILNAMLNVASGAAWVAVHHGGGVGHRPLHPLRRPGRRGRHRRRRAAAGARADQRPRARA